MEKILHEIPNMSKEERAKTIENLINETSKIFALFVPRMIWFFLTNRSMIQNATEEIETMFNWRLYPYLFQTVKACLTNPEETEQIPIIQDLISGYEKYIEIEDYREAMRKNKECMGL